GLISGLSAAMMMDGWTWEDLTLKGGIGLIINWPTMVYSPSPFFRQQSKEDWQKQRDTELKALRDAFANARAYMVAKQAKGQKGVPTHDTDPRWEAMIPVLQGKTPVVANANELSQIQAAITWAEQEGVKLVIAGGRESWRVADQLKAKNIPVIVADIQNAGRRWEDYDVMFSLPKKLFDAGVRFCITGGTNGSFSRDVPYQAANAAAYGLPKDEALKSVTMYAAQILGIADKVGSLEIGKDATLIITNGDPLEIETNVEQEFIQGKKIDLRDKQKHLYEKYKEKYRQTSQQ
ncbi:MAG: amidohydrolase family protein, partial [Ignavibacteriales bacterium]|nr:amidohydrolase family protein [Ignavibacteriales bacterium]